MVIEYFKQSQMNTALTLNVPFKSFSQQNDFFSSQLFITLKI